MRHFVAMTLFNLRFVISHEQTNDRKKEREDWNILNRLNVKNTASQINCYNWRARVWQKNLEIFSQNRMTNTQAPLLHLNSFPISFLPPVLFWSIALRCIIAYHNSVSMHVCKIAELAVVSITCAKSWNKSIDRSFISADG